MAEKAVFTLKFLLRLRYGLVNFRVKLVINDQQDNIFMLKKGLTRHTLWILFTLGIVMELAVFGISQITDIKAQSEHLFFYFTCAFLIYLITVIYLHFFWSKTFFSPELIFLFAVVFRVTFLFSEPVLSDDIYRYVWDGKVSNEGINPYRYAPDSDNLKGIRDEVIYPKVNHKSVHTIYPPLLQYLFQFVTLIYPGVFMMKLALLFFDIGIMAMIFFILKFLDRSLGWIIVYAWNPLVIVEFSGSGHADVIAIFLLLVALYLALKARSIWAGAILALSFLAKFVSLIVLPFFEDVRSRWKTVAISTLSVVLIIVTGYIPFLDAADHVNRGLSEYAANWEFNSSWYSLVYHYIQDFFGIPASAETFMGFETNNKARTVTKFILVCAGCSIFAGLFIHHIRKSYEEQKENILWTSFFLIAAMTLLSPTLHPWYVIWVIPFLCFFPNPAWILFTGLVFLSYSILKEYHLTGVWHEDLNIRLWEYVPFYVLLFTRFLWLTIKRLKAHPPEKLR
ncbi:DUF2029 domain-containing protein [bacterium]|nr:MAG: DUF2029 domain-containing protein [bacterium]